MSAATHEQLAKYAVDQEIRSHYLCFTLCIIISVLVTSFIFPLQYVLLGGALTNLVAYYIIYKDTSVFIIRRIENHITMVLFLLSGATYYVVHYDSGEVCYVTTRRPSL